MKRFQKVSHTYQAIATKNERWPREKRKLEEKVEDLQRQAKQDHIQRIKHEQKQHHQEREQMLLEITALKDEIRTLRGTPQEPAPPTPAVVTKNKLARHDVSRVHKRYQQVLNSVQANHCSIRMAFEMAGISQSTVRDLIGIAELQIVNRECYNMTICLQ